MIPVPGVETNAQIDAREKKESETAKALKDVSEKANDSLKNDLAAHIKSHWEKARNDKREIQQKMIDNLLQRRGEYDAVKLAQIRELGSELFTGHTDIKCRTALAMLREIYNHPGEKPFALEPTPLPKLTPQMEKMAEMIFIKKVETFLSKVISPGVESNPELLEQIFTEALPKFKKEFKGIQREIADEKAKMMESKIEDQLVEGGYFKALNECLSDIVNLKAGILKGPIYRKRKIVTIKEEKGRGKKVVKEEIRPEWDSPSAFDIFPLAGVTDIQKGGLIELLRYTRTDLQDMIGLPGFDEVAIREVLENFQQTGLHQWTWDADEIERAAAEGRDTSQYYDWDTIDCLEYHNAIPGRFILQWAGVRVPEGQKTAKYLDLEIDPDFDYHAVVWIIDRWILKISINENPLGRKPYYKASYITEKGTFWGRGVPEPAKPGQTLVNSIVRSVQNNVGIASGPQVGLDTESLEPGQDPNRMWPWKIWRFIRQAFSSQTQPFMQFFQPEMHVQELIEGWREASRMIDEHTGIAGFTHGDKNVRGAGNTLGGFALFAGMQNRGIKDVALTIDMEIIIPSIEALYYENYDLDDALEYIGDVKIRARGSSWLLMKETQALRRNDFLRATANPADTQIMGLEGRREALIETAKDLFPDARKIVPDPDFVKPIPMGGQGMPNPPGPQTLDQAGLPAQGVANKIQPGPTGPIA